VAQRAEIMIDQLYARERIAVKLVRFLLLFAILVALLFPFVEMISTALKARKVLYSWPPTWFPAEPAWSNFSQIWIDAPLASYFLNSFIIAGGATLLNAAVGIPAGFALARFKFPGRQMFLYFVIGTQMFSPVVLLLALFLTMNSLGLLNTHLSLILINATVALPFTVWMMTAYFASIPQEIEEAAILDGCGKFAILWDHFLPIAAPGIVTAMIFSFILAWNEFLLALTFITDARLRPLSTGIYSFVGRFEVQWHLLMAASLVAIVPVFIGFLLIEKRLVSGLAVGAVK
jgi:multiple sugar transport system permease protein